MKALEFLKSIKDEPFFPLSTEGRMPFRKPSNREVKQWLEKGSVLINGVCPKPDDEISFPINQLIFHPSSKRRCTIFWYEGGEESER